MSLSIKTVVNKVASLLNVRKAAASSAIKFDGEAAAQKSSSVLEEMVCRSGRCKWPAFVSTSSNELEAQCWNVSAEKSKLPKLSKLSKLSIHAQKTVLRVSSYTLLVSKALRKNGVLLTKFSPTCGTLPYDSELCKPFLMCNRHNRIASRDYSTAPEPQKSNQSKQQSGGLPSKDQLEHIFNVLADDLPKLYVRNLNYSIFTQDLAIIDNTKGKTKRGLVHYVMMVSSRRAKGHLKYPYVKFCIIKMTTHPEEGKIMVRWRTQGLTTMTLMLNFWKFKPWNMRGSLERVQELLVWEDGLYTYYVGDHGLVHTFVIDNVIPDTSEKIPEIQTPIPAKIASAAPTSVTQTK